MHGVPPPGGERRAVRRRPTPGTVLKVGTAHSSVDFVSHAGANQFLNSPHGRFSGTFAQINDPTFYDTHFKNEGEPYPFEGNQGGCVQCHDVHKSTLPEANPAGGAIHEECMECHAKDLSRMIHSFGPGTPFEDIGINPNTACESCHMPGGKHLFRVSSDADYSTFPEVAFTHLRWRTPTRPRPSTTPSRRSGSTSTWRAVSAMAAAPSTSWRPAASPSTPTS